MSSETHEIEVDGIKYQQSRIYSNTASIYMKVPRLGSGKFKILWASVHPSSTQTYPEYAGIIFIYPGDNNTDLYNNLKTGYIGGRHSLDIQNVEVVGPGQIAAFHKDLTMTTWFDVCYRRVFDT